MMKRPASLIRPSHLVVVGVWIAGLTAVGAIAAMVLIAVQKMQTGQALDTYQTFWAVEFNWVGFLVLMVAALLAVGLFFRYKEWREVRELQHKCTKKEHHGE